jgi:large subunit ribosomal protein L9
MVDLILLERVEKLGQMGQVVKVKPGYARNYLLPQKKAMRATKENLAYFETQRTQLEATNLQRKAEASEVAAKMDGLSVVLIRQAGESGQLYGSVAARDISDAVTEAGFTVEKGQIVLDRPIKTLGLHPVRVMLHPEVSIRWLSVTRTKLQCLWRRRHKNSLSPAPYRTVISRLRYLSLLLNPPNIVARCCSFPCSRESSGRGGSLSSTPAASATSSTVSPVPR